VSEDRPAVLETVVNATYRSQECGLASTTGPKQKNGGKLFRSGFAVEEEVNQDGHCYAEQEGDEDGWDGARERPGQPAIVPGAISRHVGYERWWFDITEDLNDSVGASPSPFCGAPFASRRSSRVQASPQSMTPLLFFEQH